LESPGLVGLYDRTGRFRKCKLNKSQKQQVKKWTKETPNNLESVKKRIKEEWEIQVSKDTFKKVLNYLK
jgi:transposase